MEYVNKELYEPVLDDINVEHNRHDELKRELSELTNRITVLKILSDQDFTRAKIFQIKVKLFDNIFALHDIFSDVPRSQLISLKNNRSFLYYVNVYIAKLFYDRIANDNWFLTVSVFNSLVRISKNVLLKNYYTNPINVIIEFEDNIERFDSFVEVHLVSKATGVSFNPIIKLKRIKIDISYYFNSKVNRSGDAFSISSNIIKINNMYNENQNFNSTARNQKYVITSLWNSSDLFDFVFQNSYHQLLSLMEAQSKCSGDIISYSFYIYGDKVTLELDSKKHILKIDASSNQLYFLKEYYFGILNNSTLSKDKFLDSLQHVKIQELEALDAEIKAENVTKLFLLNGYDKYLKCVSKYSL